MKGTSKTPGFIQDTALPAAGPRDPDLPTAAALTIAAPSRELLDELLDKWSLLVIGQLCEQPLRFNELRRKIPAVGQKSLTTTLRRLERNGMAERVVTSTRPLAVTYRITPLATSLQGLINGLMDWTTSNLPDVERARARFDEEQAELG